ncbi:unnamed protein product [Linum tenue]|uniref:Uncharacterized protein n=1 Tax=Linum tenue TaxID=586396 RepID=A0AAV0LNA1_9ROSI|nr:unnamed protein product [Linum tenue]
MAGASGSVRSMNPGFLHLQKLALELKCPLWKTLIFVLSERRSKRLNFLKKPHLLPCDHIFCGSCLPESKQLAVGCPSCKAPYADEDTRHLPFIENLVTIYKGLDAALRVTAMQSVGSDSKTLDSKEEFLKASFNHNIHARSCSFSPMSKKLYPLPSTSVGSVGRENGLSDKCSVPRGLENNNKNTVEDGGRKAKPNAQSPPVNSRTRTQWLEDYGTAIHVDQLSLCSPSFGDTPQNHTIALAKQNSVDNQRLVGHDSSASGSSEEHTRNSKRQRLNYSLEDTSFHKAGPSEPRGSQVEKLETSDVRNHAASNQLSAAKTVCRFCQSSNVSVETGPLLHFLNGNQVEGHEATLSTALHVHKICIDWAPKVYFVDDTIQNLKEELARGAKLKCSKCGKKGAALGCYVESCRKSYHVPCAMEISGCRWDFDNYLLFCPGHSSHKFPDEKSKHVKQKLKVDQNSNDDPELAKTASEQSNPWLGSKKWLFCGSALSAEEKCMLVEFGNKIDVPVTKFWRPDVTHVIASTNTEGACTRTLKVLLAILNGKWVLTIDWIKACREAMQPVDEEPYEVRLDNNGSCDGPKTGRLNALNNAIDSSFPFLTSAFSLLVLLFQGPKLFHQLNFYLSGDFVPAYRKDLQNLIVAGGGTVWGSKEEFLEMSKQHKEGGGDGASPTTLVVYNLDPRPGCKLGEEVSILWERLDEAEDVAAKSGSQVTGHTWLLESIAACLSSACGLAPRTVAYSTVNQSDDASWEAQLKWFLVG